MEIAIGGSPYVNDVLNAGVDLCGAPRVSFCYTTRRCSSAVRSGIALGRFAYMLISEEHIHVVTTAASADEARRIATELVEERLAACVQIIGPIESIYRWQGKVETATEWQCWIKTRRQHYDSLEAAIRRLHSYEVPEILAVPIVAGSEAYLKWLSDQTR